MRRGRSSAHLTLLGGGAALPRAEGRHSQGRRGGTLPHACVAVLCAPAASQVGGEGGSSLVVHPPEVREPLPLTVHHRPLAVTLALFQVGKAGRVGWAVLGEESWELQDEATAVNAAWLSCVSWREERGRGTWAAGGRGHRTPREDGFLACVYVYEYEYEFVCVYVSPAVGPGCARQDGERPVVDPTWRETEAAQGSVTLVVNESKEVRGRVEREGRGRPLQLSSGRPACGQSRVKG